MTAMTREELCATIDTVLDESRTQRGRRHAILLAVDQYAAAAVAGAFDRGYGNGVADAEAEAEFHATATESLARITDRYWPTDAGEDAAAAQDAAERQEVTQ